MLEYFNSYLGLGWDGLTDFVLPFLIVLSVLVFVHEWGHYIVARYYGVRVDVFSVGFGKEIWGWTDRSGTRWKISMIPLGGYVQMFGDSDPSSAHSHHEIEEDQKKRPMTAEEKRVAFFNKPVYQRAAIVFAGPAINFIFAILLLSCLYVTVGKPVTPPVAAAVMVDSAAEEAGLEPQDRILAIDGEQIGSFADIQRQVAISLDRPLVLTVSRGGEVIEVNVTPQVESFEDRFGFNQSRGLIGIMATDQGISVDDIVTINGDSVADLSVEEKSERLASIAGERATIGLPGRDDQVRKVHVRLTSPRDGEAGTIYLTEGSAKEIVTFGFNDAIIASFKESWFIITGTLEALGQIFSGSRSATELGGIVRIGAVAGDAAQNGIIALISFMALLSINLGLINLFPIPLLDGGHLVFYTYEGLFGKPMSEKVMDYALKCGMVFLIGLMAFANLNDIVQIIL